jgi:hypothetical protein
MANIITVEHINKTKFYQLPKAFFHNPKYIDMKNETKIAYALLRDLLELSIKNNWINSNNEVYVKLSRVKLMQRLNIKGTATMTKIIKELKDYELIVERRVGLNKVNEIYVCIPDELSILYKDEELLELEDSQTFKNENSEVSKNESPMEFQKMKVKTFKDETHTKTNITKTNITKTNNTTQRELACSILDNPNKDLIEKETHLTLSPNQCKKVSKWDIKKIDMAIKLFNRENGEYFALLDKIYSDSRNFAPNISKKGKFHSYEQRTYDFDDLESKLLKY